MTRAQRIPVEPLDRVLPVKLLLDTDRQPVGLLLWDSDVDDEDARMLAFGYLRDAGFDGLPAGLLATTAKIERDRFAEPHKPDHEPWRVEPDPAGRPATYLRFQP